MVRPQWGQRLIRGIPVSAAVLIMLDGNVCGLIMMHAKLAPQRPAGVLSLSDVVRDMAGMD